MKTPNLKRAGALALAVGFALAVGGLTQAADDDPKVSAEINAQGVAAIVNARIGFYLVDARGAQSERIPGAKPLATDASAAEVQRTLPNKKALVITYCNGAFCDKSQVLADRLAKIGYTSVIRFTGGIETWKKAGYRLQKVTQARPAPTAPAQPSQPRPQPRGSGSRGGSGSR